MSEPVQRSLTLPRVGGVRGTVTFLHVHTTRGSRHFSSFDQTSVTCLALQVRRQEEGSVKSRPVGEGGLPRLSPSVGRRSSRSSAQRMFRQNQESATKSTRAMDPTQAAALEARMQPLARPPDANQQSAANRPANRQTTHKQNKHTQTNTYKNKQPNKTNTHTHNTETQKHTNKEPTKQATKPTTKPTTKQPEKQTNQTNQTHQTKHTKPNTPNTPNNTTTTQQQQTTTSAVAHARECASFALDLRTIPRLRISVQVCALSLFDSSGIIPSLTGQACSCSPPLTASQVRYPIFELVDQSGCCSSPFGAQARPNPGRPRWTSMSTSRIAPCGQIEHSRLVTCFRRYLQ